MRWLLRWIVRVFGRQQDPHPEWRRAYDLINAIDAGGMPLNAARVNHIARSLGLEVSTKAPVDQTIARIRAALAYRKDHPNG